VLGVNRVGGEDRGCNVLDGALADLQHDRRLGADPARCTPFYPRHRDRWWMGYKLV